MNTGVREKIDFEKGGGLVPAVVQDGDSGQVLMLGYMNAESLAQTEATGLVTFYSRSKGRLWTKGEESGNVLRLKEIRVDCDGDTLLVKAEPAGPVCHTGADTCFKEENHRSVFAEGGGEEGVDHLIDSRAEWSFLPYLQGVIEGRKTGEADSSYTARLFASGVEKIAQKVGEEAVETVIDAVSGNVERMTEEAADLIYHLMVLLSARGLGLKDVEDVLRKRHGNKS